MSQKVIRKGNLEYRERKNSTGTFWGPVLVECPVCGYEFTKNDRATHISEHSPEDFNL